MTGWRASCVCRSASSREGLRRQKRQKKEKMQNFSELQISNYMKEQLERARFAIPGEIGKYIFEAHRRPQSDKEPEAASEWTTPSPPSGGAVVRMPGFSGAPAPSTRAATARDACNRTGAREWTWA